MIQVRRVMIPLTMMRKKKHPSHVLPDVTIFSCLVMFICYLIDTQHNAMQCRSRRLGRRGRQEVHSRPLFLTRRRILQHRQVRRQVTRREGGRQCGDSAPSKEGRQGPINQREVPQVWRVGRLQVLHQDIEQREENALQAHLRVKHDAK